MIASLEQASKVYQSGDTEIVALQPTDLEIRAGELILIIGPSGSGKTTLLSLLGCVIYPTQGRVNINGTYTSALNENELAKLRLQEIGFVFQSINLISPLTGLENVMLPLQLSKTAKTETRERAEAALTAVNMADRQHFLPKELSGGQQQRVAIARALVTNPELILCDEPTAALDATSAEVIMQELKQLARQNKAVAVVTHDKRLEAYADRIIKVENGFVIP
ncbi:ABC transporter ATP-binding protein [Adhaeribacter sp. BT258]|uniref:ABC transporter ATP-binding protein n=1 Tax=Adhaeribacter terrigena TaxID=2793070 RepID=A0ABS1BWP7_9BACT|nr:ABC transporter ATP-binding protein [Adhaeribacter terrigena]